MRNLLDQLTQSANQAIQEYRDLKKLNNTLSAHRDSNTLSLKAIINGTAQKNISAKQRFIEILDILKKGYDDNPRDVFSSESDLQIALKAVIDKFEPFQSNDGADFESDQKKLGVTGFNPNSKVFAPLSQIKAGGQPNFESLEKKTLDTKKLFFTI